MSDNIMGITFPFQKVTAQDHGVLFRKCLNDGILSGCDITYSGRRVSITNGYIIAAGREIRLSGNYSINLAGTNNWPFVRVKLKIDCGRISSLITFDQVSITMETANSLSGFSSLVQEDINNGGTIYEISLAILRMTNGAFSSFYSKIGESVSAIGNSAISVTIPTSAWSSNVATVSANGVSSDTAHCHLIISPAPASWSKWGSNGIRATAQYNNSLRFECDAVPTSEITANVLIVNT